MTDPTTQISPDQSTPDEAPPPERQPGVGFVGCPAARRLLRVRVATIERRRMRVECPNGCGVHDTTKPMVRALRPGEAEPELVELPPAYLEPAETQPKVPGARALKSDVEVLAAIPPDWTPAAEVAERLGYGGKAFKGRLREMRQRADAKDAPPPCERRGGVRGSPLMIRRVEAGETQ